MNPDGFYNGDIHNDAVDTETQKGVAWNSNLSGLMERYGGDLQGVTEKVDYLKNLGIEAVYLNPIWDTRQNMGYGPLSYYKISPNLGTDADLIALSQKLHENNIKLSLDAIFSYAMDDGVWANSSLNPLPAEDIFVKDADGNIQKVWGNSQIDLSKERAKELLYQGTDSVMKRYLKEPYSIDSWRFDAVNSYSPAAGTAAYKTIVKEIQDAALAENPNVLLIAEEFSRVTADKKVLSEEYWDTTHGQRGYFRRWFSGEYDQDDFASNLMDYVVRTRSMGLCTVNLYDLHDEARITNDTVADAAKIRALNLCQMIFVGAPCTYYGDEVGTTNNEDEGFGVQKINSFNWNEEEWDRSIYNLQCAMGQLRKEYTALKTGVNLFEVLDNNKKLMAFGRFDENGTVIAVTNQSDQTYTQTVSVKKYNVPDGKVLTDYITGKQYTVSGGSIQMEVLPGGNVLVTGAKSAKYGTEDVYTVKKILAETTLYKEFKPGDTVSFLQTPSQSDYTIKCEMGAVTGNESMPVGVVDQKDEKHMIFAGRIRLSGQSYLALGEILNGEVIIRAKVVDTASDGVCTVQLQKIGTDFSAVYSYNGETWYTIGKNESVTEEDKEKAKVRFVLLNGKVQELTFAQAEENTAYGYRFSCKLPAKEMADEVRVLVYYDGVKSQEYKYSVMQYAMALLTQTSDTDMQKLVKTMLNYGAYAQQYFRYHVSTLANAELDSSEQGLLETVDISRLEGFAFQPLTSTDIIRLEDISLLLKSETTLRLYFTYAEGVAKEDLKVNSETCTPVLGQDKDGNYYIAVENIAADKLGDMHTITIRNEKTGTEENCTVGALTYGYYALKGSSKESLHSLVRALYLYNQAAMTCIER